MTSWTETIGTANVWEPVEQLVETTSEARLGASLERIAAAAKFAERELGLPRNGSFEVVARSSRGAEGWRVVAVPEFGFEAVRYCGTVSGCAPERVYRSRSEALSDAEILRKAGNDVDVAPVMLAHRARGTPLPHWILSWPAVDVDYAVFHELALQSINAAGNETFRHAFAAVAARAALRRWVRSVAPEASQDVLRIEDQRELLRGRLVSMRRELAAVAASNISAMGKRDAKRATLDRARDAVARSSPAVRGGRMNLERWLSTNLNAAHLYGVFDDDGYAALFERLLSSDSNADYRNFVVRVRSIAGLPRHEQRAVLSAAVAAIE